MNEKMTPKDSSTQKDWRFPASIGLAVALSVPVSNAVEDAVADSVGYWPAFGISLLAAAAMGAIAALVINSVISRWSPKA